MKEFTRQDIEQRAKQAGLELRRAECYADCYYLLRNNQALVCGRLTLIDRRLRALDKDWQPFVSQSGTPITQELVQEKVREEGLELTNYPYDALTPYRLTEASTGHLLGVTRKLSNGKMDSECGMTLEEAYGRVSADAWQNRVP